VDDVRNRAASPGRRGATDDVGTDVLNRLGQRRKQVDNLAPAGPHRRYRYGDGPNRRPGYPAHSHTERDYAALDAGYDIDAVPDAIAWALA
jgi:hypothetical protein